MKNKIVCLATFVALSIWLLSAQCYGAGWIVSKPSHNIILMGVVYCIHDGVITPEKGATVVIRRIEDAAGLNDYEFSPPQITTTDENGMWITVFNMAFDDPNVVTLPGKYYGEIIPRCRSTRVPISGLFEDERNWSGILAFIQKRAGSLGDLAQKMASAAYKVRFPGMLSTKFNASYDYIHTDVECGTKPPPQEKTEEPVDASNGQGQTPVTPVPPATPAAPPTTDGRAVPPTPPRTTDVSQRPDAYAKCVGKCKPILDKLERLKKKLSDLEESESDEVKRLRNELEHQKALYDGQIRAHQMQQYVAPDGKQFTGRVNLEQSYKRSGCKSIPGTQELQIDPDTQKFLDATQKRIDSAAAKLKDAIEKDYRDKAAERKRIKDEMDKVLKEYEACVRSCDNFKLPGDKRNWQDFMPQKPYSDFEYNPKGDYFKPVRLFGTPGKRTDASRPPAPAPKTDAAKDAQPMPTGPAQPLVDPNGGFDKVPPTDTNNYETGLLKPGTEDIQYKQLKGDRMAVDTAVAYKPTPTGMDVTTASVATGKGSDFRKWKIDKVKMNVDGETINPEEEEDFYIEKDSYYRGAAVATFVALGSQYRQSASKAESGEVCHVTGQKKESSDRKHGMRDAIDSAGMAAGMGLLASQAKGGIPAKKSTFKLDKDQAKKVLAGKGALQTTARNEAAHQEQTLGTRLH